MKKITFILFALIAGTTFAQNGARSTATADVNAEIISPIIITGGSTLNFGRIIGNAAGGNVRVNELNERTFSNPDLSAPSTGDDAPTAAEFKVTAAIDYKYNVHIPSTQLDGDGDSMPISFTHSLEDSGNIGSGNEEILIVGGLLTVNGGQAEGEYEGTVTVTVAYE